jgi:hypothetical protein
VSDDEVPFEGSIATSAEKGRIAAKKIEKLPGGSLKETPYDFITYWTFIPFEWRSHEQATERLRALVLKRRSMMIMGRPIGDDPQRPQRRLWADPVKATLMGGQRRWLPVDFDDEPVPEPLGRPDLFAEASLWLRDHRLPEEFHDRRMVAVASAKTGLRGDNLFRGKLLVALDQAHAIKDLKNWAKGFAAATDAKIDSSVVQIGQPIYIARPLFSGMGDPVPRELHAVILAGESDLVSGAPQPVSRLDERRRRVVRASHHQSLSEADVQTSVSPGRGNVVSLNVCRFDEIVRGVNATVERNLRDCGDDWRGFLDNSVGGGPGTFFVPLTQGLGLAARSADDEATIINFVIALLAERADKNRQAAYGRDWIARTVRRFRDRDHEGHLAIARLRRKLFFGGGDGR